MLHADADLEPGDLFTRITQVNVIKADSSLLRRVAWRVCRLLGHQGWFLDRVYPPRPAPPRPPEPSIEELLESGSDDDLYGAALKAVEDRYGGPDDRTLYPPVEGVVVHVYYSSGTLGGGFERLIWYGYQFMDDDFASTIAAYEAIGCTEAAGAFRDAVALSPGGRIPADQDERTSIYGQADERTRQAINERFWAEQRSGAIDRAVAKFIRDHAEVFRRLTKT